MSRRPAERPTQRFETLNALGFIAHGRRELMHLNRGTSLGADHQGDNVRPETASFRL
jgi:hypothetical protein